MKLVFLGTGTSYGIPVIGCKCAVCTSNNKKNIRLRPSVFLEIDDKNILIDVSTDFRAQMLKYEIPRIDAVLLTHHHFDHISGIDDIRIYNWIQNSAIRFFGNKETVAHVKITFGYAFDPLVQKGGGLPHLDLNTIDNEVFRIDGIVVTPIQVLHGRLNILGFRINNFAYITDASQIPNDSYEKLIGVETLVLNTLRYRQHPTHFNIEQSVEASKRINAKRTYFTHICHDLDHLKVNSELPAGMELAYDGLEITI